MAASSRRGLPAQQVPRGHKSALPWGTTKQSAWKAHTRWIDQQATHRSAYGHLSMDSQQAAAARALAGNPDNEAPA
jgi:hypothetical protein